jgi:hypothetical protein
VSEAAQRFATYEDVLAAPEHLIAELIQSTPSSDPPNTMASPA